ncbi:MAG: diaminopimelate epimerase [Bacteroidetes bacterium]|jgi:diaminopimelate epimerase|nr:diaminopimelate epimerase [Bacteroidota bacterium]MBT4401484.1 diaminopimelate epimerase [Bacteroidota bacterium]MBT4411176.1 diaminopimelate epimerase [Bacteroidota bacterium]MBT5426932.1 diaminopimelate epimerase [Bacteroidota bacterium]MBT7463057.1 diaminopimelate epimerase [Bacteroidota bacterium]
MTEFHFQKWQATGNDFVIVDNRTHQLNNYSPHIIKSICDRKFGIGADGFMLLKSSKKYDFEMKYFNADGFEAEMCGNGGRSIVGFARKLGIISDITRFKAIDGLHDGVVLGEDNYRIKMARVEEVVQKESGIFLNTGVPHLVVFSKDLDKEDVFKTGRALRYSQEFAPSGTNVNFIQPDGKQIRMRTYERGVENETLSCGTGAVAACIATEFSNHYGKEQYQVHVPGGSLLISFSRLDEQRFTDIFLEGEARMVFEGQMTL